ncbi:MAG TPA: isoprenylcysteine carboxylmethyltransferase family protein [Planctomycetaceae bacterium]|nr:isoprenylcysteine carboxylmethyltransferase family protein [Planctomycetaceae bacterium]
MPALESPSAPAPPVPSPPRTSTRSDNWFHDRPGKIPRGWWFCRRGSLGTAFVAPLALYVICSPPLVPEGSIAALTLNALGWLAFAAGAALRLWATLYLGGRRGRTVVDQGPYSLCRHPLYLGSLLMLAGTGCFLKSATFLAGMAAPVLLYLWGSIPDEEEVLERRIGRSYADYRRRVRLLLPTPANFRTPEVIPISLHALRIEIVRLAGWLCIPLIAGWVAALRVQEWWPHLFPLP